MKAPVATLPGTERDLIVKKSILMDPSLVHDANGATMGLMLEVRRRTSCTGKFGGPDLTGTTDRTEGRNAPVAYW